MQIRLCSARAVSGALKWERNSLLHMPGADVLTVSTSPSIVRGVQRLGRNIPRSALKSHFGGGYGCCQHDLHLDLS